MLVAAGRTNFRPPDMHGNLQIFAHGFTRFHFFWATLIWPWVVAALFALRARTRSPGRAGWPFTVAFVLAVLMILGGGLRHMPEMRQIGIARTHAAHCLLKGLQEGGEIRCQGLLPPFESSPDSLPAYLYAKKIGASFVRNFPNHVTGKRRGTIAPFYQFDAASAKPRMNGLEALDNGLFRSVGSDPQLHIQTRQPQITRRCMTMDVDVQIKVSERDTLQLFYVPAGDDERYSEQNVATQSVGADNGSVQTLSFRLESETGFFESLRLDPVTRPQVLAIPSIKVYCVRELP